MEADKFRERFQATVQFRIYLVVFLVVLSFSIMNLVVPLYAFRIGATQIQLGLLGFVYFGASVLFCPLFGRLSDKVGRPTVLLISILGNIITTVLMVQVNSIFPLIFLRALQGVAASAFWPIMEALVVDIAPSSKMGEAIGLYSFSYGLSFMIGPMIGGFILDNYQSALALWLSFLLLTFSIPVILVHKLVRKDSSEMNFRNAIPLPLHKPLQYKRSDHKILFFGFLSVFLYGLIAGEITALFPIFASIIGMSTTQIGLLLLEFGFARMIAFWGVGKLGDIFDKRLLSMIGVGMCGFIALIAFSSTFFQFLPILALIAIGLGAIYPSSLMLVSEVSQIRRGYYIGIYSSSLSLGMAIGSQLGGILAEYGEISTPYYFYSATCLVCMLVLTWLFRE